MSDVTKIYRDLQKAMKSHLLFAEPPTVRLAHEVQRMAKMQHFCPEDTASLSANVANSFRIYPRLAAEMAAVQKALELNGLAFEVILNLPHVNALLGPLHVPDLLQQMRARVDVVSLAYRDFAPQLRILALTPSTMSAAHIASTASLVGNWTKMHRPLEPLLASISFTEAQVSSQQADITEYPEVFDFAALEDDEADDGTVSTHNLYYVQRTELILIARKTPHVLDDAEALNTLPTMRYFHLAQSVCRLVTIITRQCAVSGIDEIFRLTNRLVESLIAIPNLVATNQQQFGEFVDYVFFIVYEGAGKDTLRFLHLINEEDAKPVWTLKHLRNYFMRHDVEHGTAKEIKKKQERLGEIFYALIGKPLPRSRRDFGDAQLALLLQIESMLSKVSNELERRATKM